MYAYRPKDILAYEAFLNALEHPAALLDEKGDMLACNPVLIRRSNKPADFFHARNLSGLLDPAESDAFAAYVSACRSANPTEDKKFRTILHLGFVSIPVSVSKFLIGEKPVGFLCQAIPNENPDLLRLKFLMENLDQGVWDYDNRSGIFTVSGAWRKMRGLGPDDEINKGEDAWLEDIHPEDRDALHRLFEGQIRGISDSIEVEYRHRHSSGDWVWIMCSAKVMDSDHTGKPTRIVGTDTDVTNVKRKEHALRQLSQRLQMAMEVSGLGLWEYDAQKDTVYWDDRLLEIYGLEGSGNERDGSLWQTYIHPEDRQRTINDAAESFKGNNDLTTDFRIIRPDGEIRYLRSLARNIESADGLKTVVGVNSDVTEHHVHTAQLEKIRAQLEHESRHDALTGVGNRRLLDEVAESFFETISDDREYAALHLDLDHFKDINDTLGHAEGDKVLQLVATTLGEIVGDCGLTCRMGGDEFTVFFQQAPTRERFVEICERSLAALNANALSGTRLGYVGCSIGCATGRGKPRSTTGIFKQADRALYTAKSRGRNQYVIVGQTD